jgi:hypothetical protein
MTPLTHPAHSSSSPTFKLRHRRSASCFHLPTTLFPLAVHFASPSHHHRPHWFNPPSPKGSSTDSYHNGRTRVPKALLHPPLAAADGAAARARARRRARRRGPGRHHPEHRCQARRRRRRQVRQVSAAARPPPAAARPAAAFWEEEAAAQPARRPGRAAAQTGIVPTEKPRHPTPAPPQAWLFVHTAQPAAAAPHSLAPREAHACARRISRPSHSVDRRPGTLENPPGSASVPTRAWGPSPKRVAHPYSDATQRARSHGRT